MKQTIKLTEGDLHRIIRQCVNEVISESDYMDDGKLEGQYSKNPNSMWLYGNEYVNPEIVGGLEPHTMRRSGIGNKENDNNASWDYFDAVRNGADMKMRDRLNNYDYRRRNPNKKELRWYMDGWNDEKNDYDTPQSLFKDKLDKMWKDTQDIEKYSRMADSRPLHRKGSLNRALDK